MDIVIISLLDEHQLFLSLVLLNEYKTLAGFALALTTGCRWGQVKI